MSADDGLAVSPQQARRILIGMVFPQMLMPMVSTMSRVALPEIRRDFALSAEVTAWVAIAFMLPFLICMPVYARLSDGLDRRRLILAGAAVFTAGTAATVVTPDLAGLMAGRAIQGLGVAGMMPLGLALISSVFPQGRRGSALGLWSSVGPTVGFFGPLAAGFLVAAFGWRGAFAPALLFGGGALAAVAWGVPAFRARRPPGFLRTFDWAGVALLASALTCLVLFLSSRSITGAAPLTDLRLGAAAAALTAGFLWRQRRAANPFLDLKLFAHPGYRRVTFCAAMRMVGMGGLSLLVPLYLVDLYDLAPRVLGAFLMINAGAMALVTRAGGHLSDRWDLRAVVVGGLGLQAACLAGLAALSAERLWPVAALLAGHGLGVGLILAALHNAAMKSLPEADMGTGAGVYSMFRFLAAAVGTALAGVLLQGGLDAGLSELDAYRRTLWVLTAFPVLGVLGAAGLRRPTAA